MHTGYCGYTVEPPITDFPNCGNLVDMDRILWSQVTPRIIMCNATSDSGNLPRGHIVTPRLSCSMTIGA